jgi:hypothetical protein
VLILVENFAAEPRLEEFGIGTLWRRPHRHSDNPSKRDSLLM